MESVNNIVLGYTDSEGNERVKAVEGKMSIAIELSTKAGSFTLKLTPDQVQEVQQWVAKQN